MSFFTQLKYSLLGSDKKHSLDASKSLHDNFIEMCSLPFPRIRSKDTIQLLEYLKECGLHNRNITNTHIPLDDTQRKHDIAVLELAKLAVKAWLKNRSSGSERVHLVNRFLKNLIQTQNALILLDQSSFTNAFLFKQVKEESNEEREVNIWTNPLKDMNKLKSYLNLKQQHYFSSLTDEFTNTASQKIQQRPTWNYIIFAPVLNYFMEFDCLDFLFDGLNACVTCVC